MKSKIQAFRAMACVLAIATISACSKPTETAPAPTPAQAPAPAPANSAEREVSFPGGAPITPADLTVTPKKLPDAPPAYNYDPNNPNITRTEYARFAWRQFIFLNSPALKNGVTAPGKTPVKRGEIDPGRNFAASGDKNFHQSGKSAESNFSSNVLVWETFAHRSELFPAKSKPTGDITDLDPTYIFSNATVAPDQARFNNLDENSQIGQNQIFFPRNGNTPSTNPYDDHLILFQAKVNQAEYGYISSIYNADNPPASLELPPNATDTEESVEVKSAWREMSDDIDSGRYHTAEALYYVKDGSGKPQAKVGTFGLVGLHILRKMENYPAFVYTTFEQVDSLTTPGGDPTGLYLITLYDTMAYDPPVAAGSQPQAIVNSGTNRTLVPLPLAGAVDNAHGYNTISGSFDLPTGFAGPITVQLPAGVLTFDVNAVNAEVQQAMAQTPEFANSVWKYYRLVGIQVLPTNEDSSVTAPPNPLTEDFYLANIVIESSQPGIQLFKGGVIDPEPDDGKFQLVNQRALPSIQIPQAPGLPPNVKNLVMGGCMGCHGNARYPRHTGPSIFNFLIDPDTTMKGTGFSADARNEPPVELRAKALEYLPRP